MNRPWVVLMIAAAATLGCATKKHVRESLDPVNKRIADLDKRSAENTSAIQSLEEKTQKNISRVEEKIGPVDGRAGEAARLANQAGSQAAQAGEKADAARKLAEGGLARADKLEKVVENLENYRLASSATVYFDFGKSVLTEPAAKDLDGVAQSVVNKRRFFIEVQGFTDTVGAADYNYGLSERRAAAVTRYLTTQHKIPVYRVHTLGHGKDRPAEAANTRDARRLSRRVELKVYLPPE